LSTPGNRISYLENDSLVSKNIPLIQGILDIRSILPDSSGSTWIATAGNGIFRVWEDSIENLTTSEGLLSDYCYALIKDNYGNVWVSHRGGLSSINPNDGSIISLSEESGIPREMVFNANAVSKDKNGLLWFGTSSGILSYNPRQEKRLNPAPALSIHSILVNNQPIETGPEIVLSHGRYNIRIQFTGVYLKDPASVSYQYQLEGLDNRWSEFFDQNFVLFNSLPDGRYRFMIRSMNAEGVVNETPVAFDILIKKPFWKHWTFYLLVIVGLVMIITAIIQRRERMLQKEKQVLEKAVKERTEEVVLQKDKIEKQRDSIKIQKNKIEEINRNLGDSINYARRIQNAVFPPIRLLDELFPDNFLFFQPQQTVSGDFFWVTYYQGKKIVTVSDCTGHGVPGAFMSMLGITMLNELVHSTGITEASEILNHLKNDIIRALRQDEAEIIAGDGMDMTLCVYDPATSVLQYAGAFNPLVIFSGGEMQVIDADPMPVGLGAIREKKFNLHEIKIREGDVIYLFTDGYADQFGGEKGKKFSRRRFLNMLQEIHKLPMNTQKQRLTKSLKDWMKKEQQIDDITVMGIRF
jgi:serine phosphatase RsbU (regulator of sigma subunit)